MEDLPDLDLTTPNPLRQPGISFTLPNMSTNEWNSNSDFNSAGMRVVYQISNLTLNAIFPNYTQFLDYASSYEERFLNLTALEEDWKGVVLENTGPLAFLLGALLFILLISCWGVAWVFCKCCCGDKGCCLRCLRGKGGGDDLISAKLEQKRDKCKRNFCGVLFASIIVVFMFGLVCCFVTNEQMRISVERMPDEVDNSLADVDIYLNTTEHQINTLFIDNYALLSKTLNHILDQSGEIIKNGLSKRTGAQALENLTEILDTVEEVRTNVASVERSSKGLKEKVERLRNGLTDSKSRLLALLDQCSAEKCLELRNMPEIRSLRVENDFQNLPNMTEILRELSQFLGTDVRSSIEDGKRAFNELGRRIKTEIEPVLPEIRSMIRDTGSELGEVAKSLTSALSSIPVDSARDQVAESEGLIKKYAPYRYYAVLGVCLTLSFIFTLLTLGIFVGFCGRQPGSDYSNECCSRKTGSSFINCGIFFIFLTGGVLMVVAVVHFVLAGLLTQGICEAVYAQDNRTQETFHLPILRIESKYRYEVPPYHEIVRECKTGASAYTAFQLAPVYDIEDIRGLSDRFKRKAKHLASQVSLPEDATEIVFLSDEAKSQLARFSKSKITQVHFNTFAKHLEESIVSVDLRDVINRFNETIGDEDSLEIPSEVRNRLQVEILILESLQDKILTPMVAEVKRAAESLRYLFHQQKDLAQRIKGVGDAAEKAQRSLHSSGARAQVRQLANEFEGEFVRHVEDYANFSYVAIRDSVGGCAPLYNSLNATTTTFCHKIGSPLAAFWFSLTALLILFIPLLLVGMILARLYRKYKYCGYESETYYTSAYGGDADTIPLSMSANNGRRQKRGASRGDGGGGEPHARPRGGDAITSHSSGAAAHARYQSRFEDTSQNLESVLIGSGASSPATSSLQPLHSISAGSRVQQRTNLRFIDTPSSSSSHDFATGGGLWGRKSASPPPYAVAVQYTKIPEEQEPEPEVIHPSWITETENPTHTESDYDIDDFSETETPTSGAWGSQLAFHVNNHHTPPASGDAYERPPPYYYPGPAN